MRSFYFGVVVLLACGSDGTDTGNPVIVSPEDNVEPPEDCLERPRELAPEEPNALGVSTADVDALVRGEHRQPLGWAPIQIEEGPNLLHGPESGVGELVLAVEPTGVYRYIERDPRSYDRNVQQNLSVCEDQIELDVELAVTSSGGALSERFSTTLRASSADAAYGNVRFGADSLGGALTAEVVGDGWVTTAPAELRLEFSLSRHGTAGELVASQPITWADLPDMPQAWTETLAVFPTGNACYAAWLAVPAAAAVRGLSVASALSYVNAASPAPLAETGSILTYTVKSTADTGCTSLSPFRPSTVTLEAPARVRLHAPDASLDGSVDVRLQAMSEEGAIEHVIARASAESRDPGTLAELVGAFAITTPIDFSGHDGGLIELEMAATPSSSWGSLRVLGLIYPACDGGSGAPIFDDGRPCRGGPASRDELWSTRW